MNSGKLFFFFKNHQLLSEIPRCQIIQVRQTSCTYHFMDCLARQMTMCQRTRSWSSIFKRSRPGKVNKYPSLSSQHMQQNYSKKQNKIQVNNHGAVEQIIGITNSKKYFSIIFLFTFSISFETEYGKQRSQVNNGKSTGLVVSPGSATQQLCDLRKIN